MRRMFGALLIAAFGACLAAAAVAQTAPAGEWGVDELMQSLARVKIAKAKFIERKYLSMLNAPLEINVVAIAAAI